MDTEQRGAAQIEMIRWLSGPLELGREPAQIECVGQYSRNSPVSFYAPPLYVPVPPSTGEPALPNVTRALFFVSGGVINPIGHARAAQGYEVSFDK